MNAADDFNAKWPVGTRVWFWPGVIEKGKGRLSKTRTPAWMLTVPADAADVRPAGRAHPSSGGAA